MGLFFFFLGGGEGPWDSKKFCGGFWGFINFYYTFINKFSKISGGRVNFYVPPPSPWVPL